MVYSTIVDIIGRVGNDETPPYRPQLPIDDRGGTSDTDMQRYITLIRDCWAQDETARPTIIAVRARFATFNKGKSVHTSREVIVSERRRTYVTFRHHSQLKLHQLGSLQ